MTTMQVQLPDDVAETIRREGMLTPAGLADLLREALRMRAFERISAFASETSALGIPEMNEAEIAAEIAASRRESGS